MVHKDTDKEIQILNARCRSAILDNIRNAGEKVSFRSAISEDSFVRAAEKPLYKEFISRLEELHGEVILTNDIKGLIPFLTDIIEKGEGADVLCLEEPLRQILVQNGIKLISGSVFSEKASMIISGCESLVADLGAVVVSSAQAGSRRMFCFPPVHLVIARESQLVETLDDAYSMLLEKYKEDLPSMITTIAGPSRTADIEKTLVLGAHGPKRFIVCLILNT